MVCQQLISSKQQLFSAALSLFLILFHSSSVKKTHTYIVSVVAHGIC